MKMEERYESIRKPCAIYQGTNSTATECDIPCYIEYCLVFAIRAAASVPRTTDLVNNFIALKPGELLGAVDYRVGVQLDADVLGQLIHI